MKWFWLLMIGLACYRIGYEIAHYTVAVECERLGGFFVGKKIYQCTNIQTKKVTEVQHMTTNTTSTDTNHIVKNNTDTTNTVRPQVGGTHYDKYNIEPVVALRDWLSADQYRGWLRGNAIKYQIRYQDKNGIEDLHKAQWFLDELVRFEKQQTEAKAP